MSFNAWSWSLAATALCLLAAGASASEPGFYVTASLGMGVEVPKTAGTNFGNSLGIISSSVTGPALSLLGRLPVGENCELFLRGGALFASRDFNWGFGALDEKFSRTVWLAGAGVTWSFARRWAIRAEYQQTGRLSASFASGETRLRRMSLSTQFKL